MSRLSLTLALTGMIAGLGVAAATIIPGAQAQPASPGAEPALLELFTSQGCSSCPPADRLAERLARRPDLVVIARPVTYWDRLGWKDTLAREDNTALQRAYAGRGLAGQNGVYTPQLVVNGSFGAIGSRSDEIDAGVRQYGSNGSAAIRVTQRGAREFAVGIGGETTRPAELVLVAVARKVEVQIGRGENGGRTVAYTNVLRGERKIADWRGGKASHVIAADQLDVRGADAHALVLREPGGGKVLAARWLS